jgi:hypothetical protein
MLWNGNVHSSVIAFKAPHQVFGKLGGWVSNAS